MSVTAILLAIQEVPQRILVATKAQYAFLISFLGDNTDCCLVFEMPQACNYHRQIIFLAITDGVHIPDGTTWLYESADACLMSDFYAIIKREESITCQYRIFQIK